MSNSTTIQPPTLLCFDVSYILFYRYNALRRWYQHRHQTEITDDVVQTDEFKTMFLRRLQETVFGLVKTHTPTHILIAYDGQKNWRKQAHATYKANRNHTALTLNVFRMGIQWFRDNCSAALLNDIQLHSQKRKRKHTSPLPIPQVVHMHNDSLEADDLIHAATIVHQTQGMSDESIQQIKTIIIANDHDYLPLKRFPHVLIQNLAGKTIELPEGIKANQMLMYKALIGDKSDNLPSPIRGCGKKRALLYVQDNDSMQKALDAQTGAREAFERNLHLMDNTRIPFELQQWIQGQLSNFDMHKPPFSLII